MSHLKQFLTSMKNVHQTVCNVLKPSNNESKVFFVSGIYKIKMSRHVLRNG